MDRWNGRVALVTGASEGIGRCIASRLASHGMKVVACARNFTLLQELKAAHAGGKGEIIPIQCDLRNEPEILSMFDRIRQEVGGVDVCVNNAGIGGPVTLLSGSTEKWREMLEVNVLALCICTREAVKTMRERNVDDGFIVNICSTMGHYTPASKELSFYSITKHVVHMITGALLSELGEAKSHIRASEICPGLVKTGIFERNRGKDFADKLFSTVEALSVEDIADSVVYVLSAPSRAQISEMMIRTIEPVEL